jgi:quercetin dioxygenase-like cupin family protein
MRLSNVIALSLLLVCSASNAQQPGPNITTIMEAPITGQPDKVFDLYSLEWPPESAMPLHSHPGDEYGMVIKGAYADRQKDGQWKTYTAGEGFRVPAGVDNTCICRREGKKVLPAIHQAVTSHK